MWARSAPYFNFNTRHPVDFLWCLYLRSSPNSMSSLMLTLEQHQLATLCSLRLCVAEAGVEVQAETRCVVCCLGSATIVTSNMLTDNVTIFAG
jgi:hypothetical protein